MRQNHKNKENKIENMWKSVIQLKKNENNLEVSVKTKAIWRGDFGSKLP